MVLWLHDLLPEGAAATGILDEHGAAVRASRRLERAAYHAAERIVVLSRSFEENLVAKGVPAEKIDLIYYPATLPIPAEPADPGRGEPPTVICMGNIGLSQGLAELVEGIRGVGGDGASRRPTDDQGRRRCGGRGESGDSLREDADARPS